MTKNHLVPIALLLALLACGRHTSPTAPGGPSGMVYVSNSGSDRNPGTLDAPWQTIQYAVSQLQPGETLYIRGGTYAGAANVIDSSRVTVRGGTSWSNAITIAGYAGEAVTLQPPDGAAIALLSSAQQYLIFQDLIVDGVNHTNWATSDGVYISGGANHNRFLRLEVRNMLQNGFHVSNNNGNSPSNEIIQCRIHDNGRVAFSNGGYGIYLFTSDNLIERNEIYNNHGYGAHLYDNAGPLDVSRNTVRANKIHDNRNRPDDPLGPSGNVSYGLLIAWGSENMAYENEIYNNGGGVQIYTNSTNAQVYNNTIYNNTPFEGILIQYASGSIVRDNSVYGNGTDIVDLGNGTTLSNNSSRP